MTGKALKALQARMDTSEKSVDEGYIYVCELTNKRTERHIYIKVGCSKGPDDRVLQWEAKCPKNIFDHRGVWPKCEEARDRLTINEEERGDPCLYKFVLEALVKIELGHLAKISGHLPDGERLDAPKPERCACGVKHREIYAIARYGVKDRGDNDKKLWEMIDGVVQRWTWFVALYHKTPRRLSVPL
ncbi:hypothetical protein BDV93DRAFT_225034 [Ceratobasidium sp. AG-I]|nr:hypothetical protein BDV93DRAFT_225034 [Ceratobasidium sp. AG-I]